jgi:hypothetical protein
VIADELRTYLADHAPPGPAGLVFTGPTGATLRHANFRRRVWLPALARAGVPGIHFTTCAIPGTSSQPMQVQTCAS